MNLRASETGNRLARSFLFLGAISFFLPAGCAFQNQWREYYGRVDDIPVITDSEMWVGYQQAQATSRDTGKPVVLFFTGSDWCKWCTRLQDEVFDTDEFRDWAAENVIMVEVDFPQDSSLPGDQRVLNETLKETYDDRIQGFPTALFTDGKGNVIGQLGYERGGPKPWIEKANQFVNSKTL